MRSSLSLPPSCARGASLSALALGESRPAGITVWVTNTAAFGVALCPVLGRRQANAQAARPVAMRAGKRAFRLLGLISC